MSSTDNTGNNIIIIGGLLVDDIAISEEYLRPGSSNPVRWQHRLGGVATNVARVVAQQLDTLLIASVGDDNHGKLLASLLAQESMSSSLIIWRGQNSDRYTAVLDHDGELYIGLADTRLAEQVHWQDIESRLPEVTPDAIVLDANLSELCLSESVAALNKHYQSGHKQAEHNQPRMLLIALAVSPVKSQRLLPVAQSIDVLLCNRREAAALTECDVDCDINMLADALLKKQFHRFVITDGGDPILVQEHDTRSTIPVSQVDIEQNVNGAGDALAGATIAQLVLGQNLAQAVSAAGLNAARSVLSGDTSPPVV